MTDQRSDRHAVGSITFELDGETVEVLDGMSLLDALREQLGVRTVKDGCSPQGQCGCCTVLVDGSPRVACVTPVGRVGDRNVTTVDGLDTRDDWADAFSAAGASQCGFCTPGIITRLATLSSSDLGNRAKVDRALLAHLCRCTGWQSIRDACTAMAAGVATATDRDHVAAERRAELEGGVPQRVGPSVALGRGDFADDEAPPDALVAVRGSDGSWVIGESLDEARRAAGKVQGRRTTAPVDWPLALPVGDWHRTLQTTWVEPAYLEPDAAWCEPGGTPSSPLGNGGAFGGKSTSDVGAVARHLADEHGRAVRVLWTREDTVRFGPKRPPLALGLRADGSGIVRAVRPTVGNVDLAVHVPEGVDVQWVDVSGPPVSLDLRAAIWGEVAAARSVAIGGREIETPSGAAATAAFDHDGVLRIEVECGEVLDEVVLRSYCIGAAHMAVGMVRSESLSLDEGGAPHDLTIRSFGVLRSVDTPEIDVTIRPSSAPPVNGSDAVFAAVLAAAWRAAGTGGRWPV